jgi:hippurate hydrolase
MTLVPEIAALIPEMKSWRHHLHAHPETAFEETATSAFVADKLRSFGLDVHTGLAKTGVVGVLHAGGGDAAIGLRADLDALHIVEKSGVTHASKVPGKMHACGHDGHTAMLLGAAAALARRKKFDGTAYFIFQPAEENEGGGRVMVEEGLFEKFPMRAVYGMHNWPQKPFGTFAMRAGPLMGAFDIFEIIATGKGAHAAMPYTGKDPMLFVAHAISALQTIVSRNLHPLDAGVVSITQVHGGDTWNVIPQEVVLRGTARTFRT